MSPDPARNAPGPEPGGGKRPPYSILLVDDETDTLVSLAELLERSLPFVRVYATSTGKEALAVLAEADVDLVMVDYRMAKMDGLEFLRRAKRLAPGADRVMMTAFPDVNVAIQAINDSEVRRYFIKPIEPSELLQTVRALRNDHARRRAAS